MKKLIQTTVSLIVAVTMVGAPVADAKNHSNQGAARQHHSVTNHNGHNYNASSRPGAVRPGNNGRPSSGNAAKPNNGNHNGWANGNNNHRPSWPGAHQPTPPKPSTPKPPTPPRQHGHDYRHPVPVFGAYHRPVPPQHWHYRSGGPSFGTILGVALGTAIGASINSLINGGYTVSRYGNDVVYLNNVYQMNYLWPDAALYYDGGYLSGSRFAYQTPYYDLSRYNSLYASFVSQYGMPVQSTNHGGVLNAVWYGGGNRYVSLSFGPQSGQYYTTLSFGN